MLQPLQLEDVSFRYGDEIAELRDFLSKSGISVGSAEALQSIPSRLRDDRAFRRDLTSHVWVVIHRSARQITYPDLLGLLAIAAAGMSFAARAHENDAHDLLRFLMEARGSLDAVSATSGRSSDSRVEASGLLVQERAGISSAPVRADLRPSAEGPQSTRKRTAWLAAAACLLAASVAGVWFQAHLTGSPAARPDSANRSSVPAITSPDAGSSMHHDASAAPAAQIPAPAQLTPQVFSLRSPARITRGNQQPLPRAEADRKSVLSSAVAAATHERPVVSGTPASAGVSPEALHAATPYAALTKPLAGGLAAAVPAATLSKRLGARSLPEDAYAESGESAAEPRRYPRLLRRRPAFASLAYPNDASLVAENHPANVPPAFGAGHASTSNAVRAGTVRPVSLGTMAANVLYCPAPPYPAAASAAGVQGEVKVEAEVDRDGNVASARVVSGPPLLRDAAMDAVQHWRYRPWMAGGKPTSMSTIAVVEFQLE